MPRSEGSPKSGRTSPWKPPTKPLAPATPTRQPSPPTVVCERSSTSIPAPVRTSVSSSARLACRSWFPSTATTGVSMPRQAAASTSACSGSPCVVRSPASSTTSASPSIAPNAVSTASRFSSEQWMSPAAATRTRASPRRFAASTLVGPFIRPCIPLQWQGYTEGVSSPDIEHPFPSIEASLKRAVEALREAEIPFLLGGSLAIWARGGPETRHDLDFVIKPEDGDVLIDLIFAPRGLEVTDEVMARGDLLHVLGITIPVMALEDVLATKLLALHEHQLDYTAVVRIARSVREQIDWRYLRERTTGSPYAAAFFVLCEELGLVTDVPARPGAGVRVLT